MKISDRLTRFATLSGLTLKSLVKIAFLSRPDSVSRAPQAEAGRPIIILGNGPSLRGLIDTQLPALAEAVTMAVNFAANTDEFISLRPDFYLIADPHFFEGRTSDPNVGRMFSRFNDLVDWEMVLYVPRGHSARSLGLTNPRIRVENFNFVGAEGFEAFERAVFSRGMAMPRPRNVLVPAIMTAIRAGFRRIWLVGADHGWTQTLGVNDSNEVVNYQPHFYQDNDEEHRRVASVYRDIRLHDVLLSFHLAFKSYHKISGYAHSAGVEIINATPGSFIDAFPRGELKL